MRKYFKASLSKKYGKTNYYAFVTVPENLRPLVNKRQIYKSSGTNDYEEAWDRLRELEAELYLKLDHAELANHPLCRAYDALWEAVGRTKSRKKIEYSLSFNNEQHWD